MGVMLRGIRLATLALVVLALGAAEAQAAHYNFTWSPNPPVEGEVTTFTFSGQTEDDDVERIRWDLDGDPSDWEFSGRDFTQASWTYPTASPTPVTVRMRVEVDDGHDQTVTRSFTVQADPGPTAGFTYQPAAPMTGDTVTFTSTSTPSRGPITEYAWDLDGDGEFDDAFVAEPTWSYASAGTYLVSLRVTQANRKSSVAFADVHVAQRPQDNTSGGGNVITDPVVTPVVPQERPSIRLRRMRPFPVVRIAGVVLPNGALVKILSARVGPGAKVTVRCRGRACPVGAVARTSATRLLRFRKFERRLAAGTTLTIFIRKEGRIGKYTRFLIRAGKPPARVDRCLMPGRARPTRCP